MSPALIVLALFGFFILVWIIATMNRLVALRNHIRESRADIDVVLQRRHDLIPNLVTTVKGYADYERGLLERIVQARNHVSGATSPIASLAVTESELVQALNQFFIRAEAYPDLKANRGFLDLQQELANTEDRIAAARRFYNANVRSYNTAMECFPSSIIAGLGSHRQQEYFEVDTLDVRANPKVAFPT